MTQKMNKIRDEKIKHFNTQYHCNIMTEKSIEKRFLMKCSRKYHPYMNFHSNSIVFFCVPSFDCCLIVLFPFDIVSEIGFLHWNRKLISIVILNCRTIWVGIANIFASFNKCKLCFFEWILTADHLIEIMEKTCSTNKPFLTWLQLEMRLKIIYYYYQVNGNKLVHRKYTFFVDSKSLIFSDLFKFCWSSTSSLKQCQI